MFEHMLVPLDGSQLAECALAHGIAIAQAFGSRITLLHVVERAGAGREARGVDPLTWHIRQTEARAYLSELQARVSKLGVSVEYAIREGLAAEQIIDFAHTHDVDLLSLSSHGQSGLSGWNISSVVQKIVLRAYAPVLIVRAYHPSTGELAGVRFQRILVPLDCSMRGECALQHATTLAHCHESSLVLAHVTCETPLICRAPPSQEDIDLANRLTERNRLEAARYLSQLQTQLPIAAETRVVVSSNVSATLHELVRQEGVDLVTLCAHGQAGSPRWPYGNVALSFIAYGEVPLLIIQDLSQHDAESSEAERASREHKGH